MGKWAKYSKKYRKEWEKLPEFEGWLTQGAYAEEKGEGYCKLCNVHLRAQKADLQKHAKTKSHSEFASSLNTKVQPKIIVIRDESISLKKADIKLTTYIANHSSIRSIDHLGELLKELGKGSILEELKLHRTKCSSIILNVISPSLHDELISEIGNQSYSIILDESTDDTNTEKYMAYCVRYFNPTLNDMVVDFLGFQVVIRATAEQLCENFLNFLKAAKWNPENLIALATDGANNLCGHQHSLYTLLRKKFPKLQLLKCVCHSFNLCARKAGEELPSNIEFLLRESRAWFSHSCLRKKVYEVLFKKLNAGKKPPMLIKLSGTRWLASHSSVRTTLDQWKELKLHFQVMSKNSDRSENCFTARTLTSTFDDDRNLLYLQFLNIILKDVNDLNISFQATNADLIQLYDELRILLISCAQRIFKPSFLRINTNPNASVKDIHVATVDSIKYACEHANAAISDSMLSINDMDFGSKFEMSLRSKLNISKQDQEAVKKRCSNFMLRLCKEILDRLPCNLGTIEKLRYFSPTICMTTEDIEINNLPWELAPNGCDEDAIRSQWRKLRTFSQKDLFPKQDGFPETVKFWSEISKRKTAIGNYMFKDLADFALRALTLPISNAVVERVISIMGTVKTKIRNKLSFNILNAVLKIRSHLNVRKKCCTSFTPSNEMLALHNKNMYLRKPEEENEDELEALYTALNIANSTDVEIDGPDDDDH